MSWEDGGLRLEAREPTGEEIRAHARSLADWYNEPHNARMLAQSEPMSTEDVVAQYARMRADGARVFLLFLGGNLVGDADLRNVQPPVAEFAIMVGPRGSQARGLGTRFAVMIHAMAFGTLGMDAVYLSIVPGNEAARRCYLKVGYREDQSPLARRYADAESDIAMSVQREEFLARHAAAAARVRVLPR